MDAFSVQPVQQILPQPLVPAPTQPQMPPSRKINLRKFLNLTSWIIFFTLLPITVLIFLSQNSVPGDFFYPIKRSMENVILAAASVNPATKAAFRTDLTEARFKEAQSLVISKSNASGLSTFVDEVRIAQIEVGNLTNNAERQKAEEKLLAKIDQYQSSLVTLEAKTQENIIAYSPQVIPTFTPSPAPTEISVLPNSDLIPVKEKTLPTITPSKLDQAPTLFNPQSDSDPYLAKTDLTPSKVNLTPTSAPTLTLIPTVAPTISIEQEENVQVEEQKKIVETLNETKITLEEIKRDLEDKRKENKNENVKKSEKSNKGERQGSGREDKFKKSDR